VSAWNTVQLSEIPIQEDGRCPWRPIRHHLGIRAFGVNAWTAGEAGDRVINEHAEEDGEEELYLVLSGHAVFTIAGEDVDAPAGMLVFVEPGTVRTAFARQAGTTILAIGGTPGEPYLVSGWELWAPANPLYEAGEYERAIEFIAPLVEQHPDHSGVLYNLACCESLAGRPDDALEHLRRAVEIDGRFARYARSDSDFDPIRDDARFSELVDRAE